MKAFAIDDFGGPGEVRDLPEPGPAEGQVRVRVRAAGLNPFDAAVVAGYLKDRMEHRFPLVPGSDAAGTVEAVGEGVPGWVVGDEVFGNVGKPYLGEGTLAEVTTLSAETIARRPEALDATAAAAVPVAGATASTMMEALRPEAGWVVVVLGATGGVGSFFVQLAAMRGVRVIAVCSGGNVDEARRLGSAEVVDYTAGDVADAVRTGHADGIDAIADMHGDRDQVAGVAELVRQGGRVASAVGAADAEALGARGIEATNVMGSITTASLDVLAGMLERGEIASPEIQPYPLDQAGPALGAVSSGHTRGKIVVTVA